MTWVQSVDEPDYEMFSEYPYPIRRIGSTKLVSEYIETNGYPRLNLNGNKYYKHVLVAHQFLENDDPEHKTEVDHKVQERTNYHVSNLRWCTPSENNANKLSHKGVEYEWFDELPEDSLLVTDYGNHQFEDYFYSPSIERFIYFNGLKYRWLHVNFNKSGNASVRMRDLNNVGVTVYYSKFRRIYGLD